MTTRVSISQVFDLSVDDVFEFFGDHEKFGSLLPVPVTRIVNSPDENPNGVGSVRKVGIGPLGVEETILTWNQSSQIQYTISKGAGPIKNYLATISFSAISANQCQLDYDIEFDFAIPLVGALVGKGMKTAFEGAMKSLAASPMKIVQAI